MILGLNHRLISVDAKTRWGVTGKMVKTAYEEDRKQGKWPFAFSKLNRTVCVFKMNQCTLLSLVGTVGTTSSGANDHIEEIEPIST